MTALNLKSHQEGLCLSTLDSMGAEAAPTPSPYRLPALGQPPIRQMLLGFHPGWPQNHEITQVSDLPDVW